MELVRQFHEYAWLKPDWCFPSRCKETDQLLRQCMELAVPQTQEDNIVDDVIARSNQFPIAFPIETVRLKSLKESRPIENLEKNIRSTYPLIHERVLLLMANFIVYKREFGSPIEKALYKDMSILDFIDRILKKRAISFVGKHDAYKLITGEEGHNMWELVGNINQKPPLVLENCLSYDEQKLAAMVFVSGHTEFINNGDRKNKGRIDMENVEENGVIIGLIGARLKRKFRMEYEDLVINETQNGIENGYGEEVTPTTCLNVLRTTYVTNSQTSKNMWRQIWAEFYQVPSYTYEELHTNVKVPTRYDEMKAYKDRYVRREPFTDIFDNEVFYKRLSIPFDCALIEADHRAKEANKSAYLNVVGIGLGVWKISLHQTEVFVLAFLERIKALLKKDQLKNISDINFSYIDPNEEILNSIKKNPIIESKKHPKGGIKLHVTKREPSTRLTDEHSGKLLVTTFAWDSNAHPGNEFWDGSLESSGDPAAACSTQIAELFNAHINPRYVASANTRVVGAHGILPIHEYCANMLGNTGWVA